MSAPQANENSTTTTTTIKSIKPLLCLSPEESEAAVGRFQEFVRFETVSATSPDTGAYKECAAFLKTQLEGLGVLDSVLLLKEAPEHSPVVVAHWKGLDDTLPILLLNSHYDVVPADVAAWTVPPFAAIRKDGKIYGRGTQDMKCVCMQYIEALRQIILTGYSPQRSIYLTFVPDEEIGGSGMAAFLESALYKSLPPIALCLDEGLASTANTMDVFYGERLPWWIDITATGPTGHGSRFIENTAVEQLLELTKKALAFRQGQKDLLGMTDHENCTHAVVAKQKQKQLGDVTSLNITTLQAGVPVGNTFAYNCVPPQARCSLDIRISPHMEPADMKDLLDTWCQECSLTPGAVSWSYMKDQNSAMTHATTNTDRQVNPWYAVFCDTLATLGIELVPQVFPAATDSRFLRALGIRALGFSPMRNTEILLHENDEYILETNYLEGIGVYFELIQALASQGDEMERLVEKKRPAAAEE
jgi:aminoacylase